MLLRERQKEFVQKNIAALMTHGNTLGVAPTGAGKTICLSAVIGELIKHTPNLKACVLAHRDELTYQNESKFKLVNPTISTSILDSRTKSWDGQVTFAMVQTLSRENNLKTMPKLDLLVIDEAHHITAESYISILNQATSMNSRVKIFGVTATPARGDKSSLGKVFNNCGDQIKLGELILSGHLVRPKTWIIDTGNTQEKLQALKVKATGDYSEQEMASILDTEPLNSEVVRHWREKAGDRKTVVFCSNSIHARNVVSAYKSAGVKTGLVTCDTSFLERESVLEALKCDKIQVIVNVAVLTEGWDFPPISCVVLLRSSSYKSTMIQMIGRGLRTIDPSIYPNTVKHDCVILDFGISSILHGSLEQSIDLNSKNERFRLCPSCKKQIAKGIAECPLCGADLNLEYARSEQLKAKRIIENFAMAEIDLLKRSNFSWTDLRKKNKAMIAAGFNSWCCVFEKDNAWLAVGGSKRDEDTSNIPTKIVYKGGKLEAIAAANDFLYCFEDEDTARKTASWRNLLPSEAQKHYLPANFKKDPSMNRGDAAAIIAYSLRAEPKLKQIGVI